MYATNETSISITLIMRFKSCNEKRSTPIEVVETKSIDSLSMHKPAVTCQFADGEVIWCNRFNININLEISPAILVHEVKENIHFPFTNSTTNIRHESTSSKTQIDNLDSTYQCRVTPLEKREIAILFRNTYTVRNKFKITIK